MTQNTIVVIGSGFSGVMATAHLLHARTPIPLHVVMLNRSGVMARGVAYGTNSPVHLLNVPAARMTAFPDDPEHFLRFVRERDASIAGSTFVRRSVYGEYLQHILRTAETQSAPNTLTRVVGEALSLEPLANGVRVRTNDSTIDAARVMLAIGNYPPAAPPGVPAEILSSAYYVRDPWGANGVPAPKGPHPALLIGTGLTMLDVALELHALGWSGAVAVSRRGLLPQPHDLSVTPPTSEHVPEGAAQGTPTLNRLLHATRQRIATVQEAGGNWRQVIDSLRSHTPRLWRGLSVTDKQRFMRHLRPYWDVHRHRVPPATAETITKLIRDGWLTVRAGRFTSFVEGPESVRVSYNRKRGEAETRDVGAIINCTGPASQINATNDPLLNHMLTQGIARTDALQLGIDVADNGAVVNAEGTPSSTLFYVGPFLKARDGEGTAVPELRVHAARAAATVVSSFVTQ